MTIKDPREAEFKKKFEDSKVVIVDSNGCPTCLDNGNKGACPKTPLSEGSKKALEEGLASAKTGKLVSCGSFEEFADPKDERIRAAQMVRRAAPGTSFEDLAYQIEYGDDPVENLRSHCFKTMTFDLSNSSCSDCNKREVGRYEYQHEKDCAHLGYMNAAYKAIGREDCMDEGY